MIEKRPFREPYSEEKAADVLKEERRKKYDPQIVDTYLEILNRRIKEKNCGSIKGSPAKITPPLQLLIIYLLTLLFMRITRISLNVCGRFIYEFHLLFPDLSL